MANKYQSLNVLNNRNTFIQDLENPDSVSQVMAMLSVSGNRAQRKKLEKTLRKVETVHAKCEEYARKRADKELNIRVDSNFMYLFACVGLTLNEDYHWKEDPDQEHGQITSFFERLTKKIEKYAEDGLSTEDIINLLEERTGVSLQSTASFE